MRLLQVVEGQATEGKAGQGTPPVAVPSPAAYQPVPDATGHSDTIPAQQWAEAALLRHAPACPPCQHEAKAMGLWKARPDTLVMDIEVEGLAKPIKAAFDFEPPDYSVGINGGWFLVEAVLPLKVLGGTLDRDDFEALFGATALRVAEENAGDLAWSRYEGPDRTEEE